MNFSHPPAHKRKDTHITIQINKATQIPMTMTLNGGSNDKQMNRHNVDLIQLKKLKSSLNTTDGRIYLPALINANECEHTNDC